MKYFADILTAFRLIFAVALLLVQCSAFVVLYILCGVSDMLDGTVARLTHTESRFGARLDSLADLVFVLAAAIRILPLLRLPPLLWIAVGLTALVRLLAYAVTLVRFHRFAPFHTYANKATGALLFLLPLLIHTAVFLPLCTAVCVAALLSAAEELALSVWQKRLQPDVKSILFTKI